jgi:tRNA(fMet)-specific endonuclease VapC
MTLRYLVDTDRAIHYLHGHVGITVRLEELKAEGLGLSVISLAELYEGIDSSRDPQGNEQALRNFLAGIQVVGIDEETCEIFGRERGRMDCHHFPPETSQTPLDST